MSDSDSDSSPRPKKTGGRPNFNRLKIKKKTPVSQSADSSLPPAASGSATIVIGDDDDENVIKFFDRAKETYNPLPRKVLHKKRRSESEESDLPPTKKQRPDVIDLDDSGDDDDEGDDDDDEESSAARGEKKLRRAALVRQRYEQKQQQQQEQQKNKRAVSDEDSDDDGGRKSERLNARRRISDDSLYPLSGSSSPHPQPVSCPASAQVPTLTIDSDDEVEHPTVDSDAQTTGVPQDDEFAAIEARARARVRSTSSAVPAADAPSPTINILVTDINNKKPLIIRRLLNQKMKEVREYWCKSQGFTPAQTAQMFLIFKRRFRIYDSNSCQTIGVTVDPEGRVRVRGGTEGLVNENVHFEVVTEAEYQRLMARDEMEEEEEEEEEPEETLRLTLKTKGKDEFKIKVRPSTTITDLIQAYRKGRDVDDAKTVRLDFEGDILQPTDTIGDTELEDSCMVDVYIN